MSNNNQHVNSDLFHQLKDSMSEQKLKEYNEIGQQMYSIDFNQSDSELPIYVAYVSEALKSGMHPDYLDENEKNVMEKAYGTEWPKRFGF